VNHWVLDKDLSLLNTLAIPSRCERFIEIQSLAQVVELYHYLEQNPAALHILGGGSNLLLNDYIHGVVAKVGLLGVELLSADADVVRIKAAAGENWHGFIESMVHQGYFGLENLALIPGTVGASPVQNIGAYGVEVADCLESVEAFDFSTGEFCQFNNEECLFAYRDSRFKKEEGRFLITHVTFKLETVFHPRIHYGPLQKLSEKPNLSALDVFLTVIETRNTKLPDPAEIPNAGSFFKNPVISKVQLQSLLDTFPDLVWFDAGDQAKIAAGWLIDSVGLKGQSNEAGVGCYDQQALVLVNPEQATYQQVQDWSDFVQREVREVYDIQLEPEPRFWA
jgi:UDP-N-acetylmuramate dehydrogenase